MFNKKRSLIIAVQNHQSSKTLQMLTLTNNPLKTLLCCPPSPTPCTHQVSARKCPRDSSYAPLSSSSKTHSWTQIWCQDRPFRSYWKSRRSTEGAPLLFWNSSKRIGKGSALTARSLWVICMSKSILRATPRCFGPCVGPKKWLCFRSCPRYIEPAHWGLQ